MVIIVAVPTELLPCHVLSCFMSHSLGLLCCPGSRCRCRLHPTAGEMETQLQRLCQSRAEQAAGADRELGQSAFASHSLHRLAVPSQALRGAGFLRAVSVTPRDSCVRVVVSMV